MSTTGIESWAVNVKDIGAIYPFQGSEGMLVVIGLVTWIVWHVWCASWERNKHEDSIARIGNDANIKEALSRDEPT